MHDSIKKITISVILAVSVFALLNFTGRSAMAYSLEGPRWALQPPPGQCCAILGVQFAGIHYSSDYTAWDNGMYAWINSPALISWYVESSSAIQLYDTNSVGWSGLTWYYDVGFFITATGTLNYYYLQNYPSEKSQGSATHELGHIAGLAHSSGCVIMVDNDYSRWDYCRIKTPQIDDDLGIDALY